MKKRILIICSLAFLGMTCLVSCNNSSNANDSIDTTEAAVDTIATDQMQTEDAVQDEASLKIRDLIDQKLAKATAEYNYMDDGYDIFITYNNETHSVPITCVTDEAWEYINKQPVQDGSTVINLKSTHFTSEASVKDFLN